MPQHVEMHEEREFRCHARPGNHALISGYGQRRAALRDEDVWGRWGFAQELAQRAAFPRRYRMHTGISVLSPAHMQAPGGDCPPSKAESGATCMMRGRVPISGTGASPPTI